MRVRSTTGTNWKGWPTTNWLTYTKVQCVHIWLSTTFLPCWCKILINHMKWSREFRMCPDRRGAVRLMFLWSTGWASGSFEGVGISDNSSLGSSGDETEEFKNQTLIWSICCHTMRPVYQLIDKINPRAPQSQFQGWVIARVVNKDLIVGSEATHLQFAVIVHLLGFLARMYLDRHVAWSK